MNNEHKVIKELLPLYIDNELSEKDEADVLEHLAHCDACQNDLNMLIEIQSTMKLDIVPVPDGFHEATMAKIKQHHHNERPTIDYRRYLHVASLILFVAVIGTIGFHLRSGQEVAEDGAGMRSYMVVEDNTDTSMNDSAMYESEMIETPSADTEAALDDQDRSSLNLKTNEASSGEVAGEEESLDANSSSDQDEGNGESVQETDPANIRVDLSDDSTSGAIDNSEEQKAYTSAGDAQEEVLGNNMGEDNESLGNILWILIPLGLSICIAITFVYRQRRKDRQNPKS